MTTLPPEDTNAQNAAGEQAMPQVPPAAQTPPVDPLAAAQAAPQVAVPAADPLGAPAQQTYLPPQQPGQAPQPGYAPPAGGYQPPQQGYAPPQSDPVTTITLNYWLSVFFSWIPALIFWVIEKDKGNQQATAFHTANLNFSLLRTGVGIVIGIFAWIPILGWIIAGVLGIASLGLFVLHIIAAVSAAENYKRGAAPGFMFNIPLIK